MVFIKNVNSEDLQVATHYLAALEARQDLQYNAHFSADRLTIYTSSDVEFQAALRLLGGKRERIVDKSLGRPPAFTRRFEGFEITVRPPENTDLCRKVPTGNKIPQLKYPQDVEPTLVEVDEYTWECAPALSNIYEAEGDNK